jgi:hypothetical protein
MVHGVRARAGRERGVGRSAKGGLGPLLMIDH